MLVKPSGVTESHQGSLAVVNQQGKASEVAEASLPFESEGGFRSSGPYAYAMTVSQNRPMPGSVKDLVAIYFGYEGGKLNIQDVDNYKPETN